MDVAERELERMVERRAANGEHADDPESREEGWKESVRRYNTAREYEEQEHRRAFHEHMRRIHTGLASEHEVKARRLSGELSSPGRGEGVR